LIGRNFSQFIDFRLAGKVVGGGEKLHWFRREINEVLRVFLECVVDFVIAL
jgi:hypothetical protein